MIKTLQNTLKQDKEIFTVPRSVQDIIPIRRIWPDGVFQFGSKYSKTLRFSDINYAIASKEDSHVGIVCGFDSSGNIMIIHCASGYNNVVVTGKAGFTTVARPEFYQE